MTEQELYTDLQCIVPRSMQVIQFEDAIIAVQVICLQSFSAN